MTDDRHENYLRKNSSLSRAWELEQKDKYLDKAQKGEAKHTVAICNQCKKEKPTLMYRMAQTNRAEGSASFGIDLIPLCDDCKPKKKDHSLNKSQIKGMLKQAKRGRI